MVSLLNAVILLVAVGIIIAESIGKLLHPTPVEGAAIAWTAGVGVVINAVTAWLFMKDKEKDLNIKGAYLHMAADTLVSVGAVSYTHLSIPPLNVEGGDTQKNTFYWKLMHLHTYWADSPTVLGSLQRVSGLIRKLRCVHE